MATKTALILNQDGTVETKEYNEKDSLATLQAAVGGYIEGVGWMIDGSTTAYANEEGLYTPGLVPNLHFAEALGQRVMGNVVFPNLTDALKRKLAKKGFEFTL